MVWFQCEDCGENLKKPKLANHFRICSASRFSCIDCGVIFEQQNVQIHTQCITEAEKYGPKGQGQTPNGSNAKPNKQTKEKPDVDINMGLSQRPPWFCSLCNTKATSQQTLLLHADGKKHRAKARAFHAKQQPQQTEESAPDTKDSAENKENGELPENKSVGEDKLQDHSKDGQPQINSVAANGCISSNKKRKLDDSSDETGNGEVTQMEKEKAKKSKHNAIKEGLVESAFTKEDTKKKIKWKKLIKEALKSSPDGVLKMRKLQKRVLKALQESGVDDDKSQLSEMLQHKITSSARYSVDGKNVRLAAKD
ncbi:mitogen-activated protein kinase kinase 2 [Hibiscus syriacus]|uniref:Mitogen-activated protein kinase kinase 2 n=1 Tax=Hibiscus syriacus TaxID=106335 RepID=A0A6A3BA27_HIBSY|nr:UBP1-associated proteins 1C-like [Hibiscus syriacus]KAE8712538.1 mitogen-activated protein kinase kinase 2 [Hibiscus syriacus]